MSHILEGKIIKEIELADHQESIKFVLDSGRVIEADCWGDCCSHTWIEDVINPELVIGSPVLEAKEIELPDTLEHPTKTDNYEEEMQYYGFEIKTAKGVCTIAYRNSSNGYYGGSLDWPRE